MKKKYTIRYRKPSMANKRKNAGRREGFSREEAICFMAECLAEKGTVCGIKFDNKAVLKEHADLLVEIAGMWDKITAFEKSVKAGAARREKLARYSN
jgi:hypothetical protein